MAKVIAIANQKGGVGKTTTSINLGACLAAAEKRTLVVDLDPQGNASVGLGLEKSIFSESNVYHAVIGEENIQNCIYDTELDCLKICPSDNNLIGAEVELINVISRESKLKRALLNVDDEFDFIIIDCPPSMGILTLNAMVAVDTVLVPLQCEYYALEGLSYLLSSIQKIKKNFNPKLDLLGVVLTMYDKRNTLSVQVADDVKKHLKNKVFKTVIPRNVKVSEAPSHGKPVLLYDIKCPGSQAYMNLVREILNQGSKQ